MKKCFFLTLFCVFVANIYSQTPIANDLISAKEKLLHPPPVPYFFIKGLCFGDTTYFINKTTSSVISSQWDIMNDKGDTIYHSIDKEAAYYFKKRGFYRVCLSAYNGHTAIKTRTIRVDTITKADFTFRYCYDEFDNQSACSDQFVWVLPDNSISTDTAPVFKFSAPGKYPVKLIAKRGNKADTLLKLVNVRGDSVAIPDATFTCKRIDTSTTFEFTAVDSLANAYSWYFGDNQGDDTSGYKVIHHINKNVYSPPVNLFVTNGCGVSVEMLDPFTVTEIPKQEKTTLTVMVYPNPAVNELVISIGDLVTGNNITLRLMDGNGSLVSETQFPDTMKSVQFKYDTSQLSQGIYLLQIEVGQQFVSKKFIVR